MSEPVRKKLIWIGSILILMGLLGEPLIPYGNSFHQKGIDCLSMALGCFVFIFISIYQKKTLFIWGVLIVSISYFILLTNQFLGYPLQRDLQACFFASMIGAVMAGIGVLKKYRSK